LTDKKNPSPQHKGAKKTCPLQQETLKILSSAAGSIKNPVLYKSEQEKNPVFCNRE
jgi:hypothetical protein